MSKLRLFIHKWWPIFALIGMPLQGLLILAVAFFFIYNKQAERRWEAHLSELSELGEILDPTKLGPPTVDNPDENFAEAPIVKALLSTEENEGEMPDKERLITIFNPETIIPFFSERSRPPKYTATPLFSVDYPERNRAETVTAILQHLELHAKEFADFRNATERPGSNSNLSYSEGFSMLHRDIDAAANAAHCLDLISRAQIESGNGDAAYDVIKTQLHFAEHIGRDATLISSLVANGCRVEAISTIQMGIAERVWSERQCHDLALILADSNITHQMLNSFRMERASFDLTLRRGVDDPDFLGGLTGKKTSTKFFPSWLLSGWALDNSRFFSEIYQDEFLTDQTERRLTNRFARNPSPTRQLTTARIHPLKRYQYFLALLALPMSETMYTKGKRVKTYADHARIALALEIYRQRQGRFPDQLTDVEELMVGDFPIDLCSHLDYIYSVREDGSYLLYGIGANQTDDGGLLKNDEKKGDWVWLFELPESFDRNDYLNR